MKNIIKPKTQKNIKAISKQEKEDIGLLIMMMETNRSELVSREEIMKKLNN